jgi:predicted nucleotidyltransferase
MTKNQIIEYLKSKKETFRNEYGVTTLGLYGSYARDEATDNSDVDIFYLRDESFELKSGLELMFLGDEIANELNLNKVDFVSLKYMNPIIKHYAQKDFIYV